MISGTTLQLGPGDGLVASFGAVALLAGSGTDPSGVLVATVRDAAAYGPTPGRRVARKLAGLLTGDGAEEIASFGVLAEMDDGLLVFLSGAVEAAITQLDGSITLLSGADAATWVDRVLPAGTAPVELCFVGATEIPGPTSFELESGVVPGGWIRLRTRDTTATTATTATDDVVDPTGEVATVPPSPDSNAPTEPPPSPPTSDPAPEPEPDSESEVEFESFVLTPDRSTLREPLPRELADQRATIVEPVPGSAAGSTAGSESDDADLVAGILCSRQHFNSPDSGYCSTCGISMVHQTHNLVHRPRPPLGFLVFDDGSTFTLDGRYLLGREPETDPLVQMGEARPIALDDPEMSVSRVHAELRLVDWEVELIDRGSTNGTHIWDVAGNAWVRLSADVPQVVQPGVHAAVGQRTFVYESPHRT